MLLLIVTSKASTFYIFQGRMSSMCRERNASATWENETDRLSVVLGKFINAVYGVLTAGSSLLKFLVKSQQHMSRLSRPRLVDRFSSYTQMLNL